MTVKKGQVSNSGGFSRELSFEARCHKPALDLLCDGETDVW